MAETCGCIAEALEWRRATRDETAGERRETPFWYVDLPSEDVARTIAKRALLVRGIVEEWGSGSDDAECARAVERYDAERKTPFLREGTTFRVEVEDFGIQGGRNQLKSRLDALQIPFEGKARLKGEVDNVFWSAVSSVAGEEGTRERRVFFGRLVGRGDRSMIKKYELPGRQYVGPTSMDAEVALLMANMAQARPGGVVMDPFCGTGSMLVAAAHYGALTMGLDIDPRVIKHGKAAKMKNQGKFMMKAEDGSTVDVWSNFAQYGLPPPVLIHGDLHALPTRAHGLEGYLQGIVADPPYGVRAGGRKSGGRKPLPDDYSIPEELKEGHIPSTAPYPFGEMCDDLLDLAARFLSVGGKLVFFLPGSIAEAEREIRDLPTHPLLRLRWHSLETFNNLWGRRLVTYEKIAPWDRDVCDKARSNAVEARARNCEPDLIERMRTLVYQSRESRIAELVEEKQKRRGRSPAPEN